MPFAKGTPKPPGSGRKKGGPGKRINSGHTQLSKEVSARLNELGCDPITGMAIIAMDETADLSHRVRCFTELAQYVYPKRRAVEVSGIGGGPIETRNADTSKQALEDRISGIAERIRTGDVTR